MTYSYIGNPAYAPDRMLNNILQSEWVTNDISNFAHTNQSYLAHDTIPSIRYDLPLVQ